MLYKLETDEGQILIDKNVAEQIVEEQVDLFAGKLWLVNHKGAVANLVNRIGVRDAIDDIEIQMDEKGISLRIYVVIRFGVSIRTVTGELIAAVRKALEAAMEMKVNQVSVVVTGTLSKHLAKRNIEING